MFFVDKWIHSNSLINVQPEENCRIDEWLKFEWMEFRSDWYEFRSIGPNPERLVRFPNDWSEFRTIGPNSERLVRIPNDWSEFRTIDELDVGIFKNRKKNCRICWIALLLRCGGSCVQSNLKMLKCWWPRKKIGVDWPRQSQFREKKSSKSQCSNRKTAWTGLGKVKRPLQRQVSFNFLQDWSPGGRRSVLHFDGLPLTRGVVAATPFAAAVSLTFSLVKNLKMLLQAKRQPG
jgi:hypothetical protein